MSVNGRARVARACTMGGRPANEVVNQTCTERKPSYKSFDRCDGRINSKKGSNVPYTFKFMLYITYPNKDQLHTPALVSLYGVRVHERLRVGNQPRSIERRETLPPPRVSATNRHQATERVIYLCVVPALLEHHPTRPVAFDAIEVEHVVAVGVAVARLHTSR